MDKNKWIVKKALPEDADRWFTFASAVKDDFCGLDLSKDRKYRSGMIKNMNRGTAIYVEDDSIENCPIIGAMSFSLKQNHISWLAVHPNYRKRGVASSLMDTALEELDHSEKIRVKTFRDDDKYGKPARSFYKKHGFKEGETLEDENYPHPVQVFTKIVNDE